MSSLPEDELKSLMSGPAFYSNKMYVTTGNVVRISFSEALEGVPPQFRTAVVLSLPDALDLRNLLQKMLEPFENELIKARSATPNNAGKESGNG